MICKKAGYFGDFLPAQDKMPFSLTIKKAFLIQFIDNPSMRHRIIRFSPFKQSYSDFLWITLWLNAVLPFFIAERILNVFHFS
ncbi:hypothetical protein A1D23_07665 [Chelonobacter oris]|uniref:Uncharacterized protein n=1 Tax=Chelonobacter oris TaxID=505317 RepID=A0A0A3AJG7_9PAST|nr:hypothetical protein OA57_11585 [Chelonobacter oris]MDH3000069.1 hypothetical protein [Chelonobacter oris]